MGKKKKWGKREICEAAQNRRRRWPHKIEVAVPATAPATVDLCRTWCAALGLPGVARVRSRGSRGCRLFAM